MKGPLIKVSENTKEELSLLKKKGDTYDDVIQYLLYLHEPTRRRMIGLRQEKPEGGDDKHGGEVL